MIRKSGERHLHAFLRATRIAIDPNSSIMLASTPYVVGGGGGPASLEFTAACAAAAHEANADYLHLEFASRRVTDGPANVQVGMVRGGKVHVLRNCRFWLGHDRKMLLVATSDTDAATMSFNSDGVDLRPGLPIGDLDGGYSCAATWLGDLARKALASNDFMPVVAMGGAA